MFTGKLDFCIRQNHSLAIVFPARAENRPCLTSTPKMVIPIPINWTKCGMAPSEISIKVAKTSKKLKKIMPLPHHARQFQYPEQMSQN